MTRRSFLTTAAVGVAGVPIVLAGGNKGKRDPLAIPPGTPPSRVVYLKSRPVVDGSSVHRILLQEMIEATLTRLTGKSTLGEGWRAILKPDDVIGIKFNQSGQELIGTTVVWAETLVSTLVEAGWQASQIVCVEAPPGTAARLGTSEPVSGYRPASTKFSSGEDQFASVLDQVTAIVNVPFLKTHNIAGLTCCLKNLSHGLVRHPARYHRNRCSPYVADIVATPDIRSKLRLHIVDALRVVYDGGPEPTEDTLRDEGLILASYDPVAADAVALGHLNGVRAEEGLSPVAPGAADIPYLVAAHERGLGIAVGYGIELERVSLG